ncbi:MAG: imidazoleglycerol-phosphate dehydratase HisB [Gammaproteobacteria bacterium]|nr:imidazoleglycerol-phosphate dehydratase HisB [Gammaproteobacteria bacterium]
MTQPTNIIRETKETSIDLTVNIYGNQHGDIDTGLPFLDHMLMQLVVHGGWDLTIKARGDIEVDDHHLVEDIAITLGQALEQQWRACNSFQRYGQRLLPMDATLVMIAVDISGRPYSVTDLPFSREFIGNVATEMWEHFFYSMAINAKISLHIKSMYFDNNHHLIEAAFKGLAYAFKEAFTPVNTVNTSKGVL